MAPCWNSLDELASVSEESATELGALFALNLLGRVSAYLNRESRVFVVNPVHINKHINRELPGSYGLQDAIDETTYAFFDFLEFTSMRKGSIGGALFQYVGSVE